MTMSSTARFSVGELVQHRMFDYRGVVVDVDPYFMHSDEWYEEVAKSRPPKDEPWYRVLVHDSYHDTYVAERNLESDPSGEPIDHPMVASFFSDFDRGRYEFSGRAS